MEEKISTKPALAIAITPRRNASFIWRKMGAEAILFNPSNNETYMLNQTGTAIWELCDGTHSLEDIVDAIADRYETGKEKAGVLQDTVEFIKEGDKGGYLVISD